MFTGHPHSPRLGTRVGHASTRIAITIALLAGVVGGVAYYQTSGASVALGSVTEVQVTGVAGIPADAAAVAVNIAAVSPADAGYLSAYPCGGSAPTTSTVNHDVRNATSNSAIVKVGTGGKICIYSMSRTDIVVDVTGWFAAGSGYTSLDPVRFLDTRAAQPITGGTTREVQITGRSGVPANAAAVAVNLAAVDPTDAGYLTAFPCGGATPTTSTVNHDTRYATSNSAVVKIGTGGKICIYAMSTTDVVVDVTGWFAGGSGYTSLDPVRFLDSRTTQRLSAKSTREVQITGRSGIPTNAAAVAVNLAAVGPSAPGYLSAFPCGGATPTTSTVNHDTSYATSNSAIVKLGTGGKICIYSMSATDIVVDVTGWFSGSGYTALDPQRLLDTRTVTPSESVAPGPTPPASAQFVATFDGNTGLDKFDFGVWHRDPYLVANQQWSGDHDLNCGTPDTQRTIHRSNPSESFYLCKDHLMTSVGDTSGYSVAWFSPKATFNSVSEIRFSVNLTDLGDRKWWKVGVVSNSRFNSTYNGSCCGSAPGFLASDVGAADLPTSLETNDMLLATWSGGASAGYPGCMKIGDNKTGQCIDPAPNDKATRFPVSLVDNHNGTITFTVDGVSATSSGSFPACPCRVVFYDHNYTPDKDGVPIGHTWHWDDIVVI